MAVDHSNLKIVLFSILTISSFSIFYWLYHRKKRKNSVTDEIRNDVVLSSNDSRCNIQKAETSISQQGVKVLVERLRRGDVKTSEELEKILLTLLKSTAFTSLQICFLECNGITATADNLKVDDDRIKEIVLQIMNNMALHQKSQKIIKNYIPQLAHILQQESSYDLVAKSLKVLTNLSVFDEYHNEIVKETSSSWSLLLQSTHLTVKMQTLKLLVNLSTNPSNVFVLSRSELLHQVSYFGGEMVQTDLCLRSMTYVANILGATQRLKETSLKYFIVSIPGLKENTRHASRSEVEDVRYQANRALAYMS